MQKGIRYFILAFLMVLCWACNETREVSPDQFGSDYFPLKVGQYSIYEVRNVEYLPSGDSLVSVYELRERISEQFDNLENGISYVLLREKRDHSLQPWETDSVWMARKDEFRGIRVENNVPVIRFTFPVSENKKWNANALNDLETDEYEMVNTGMPFTGNGISYDQTVTVVQEYIPDWIVNFISKKEIYAMQVGLVYKENIILKFKQGEFLGEEIVDSGTKYFQLLKEHVQE